MEIAAYVRRIAQDRTIRLVATARLRDPVLLELRHQCLGPRVLQLAERPVKKVHVGVDDVRGSSSPIRLLALDSASREHAKGSRDQHPFHESTSGELSHDSNPPLLAQVVSDNDCNKVWPGGNCPAPA